MVDEVLRVDEAVQFGVRKCPVDLSVSFRGVAVEIVRAENDFERPAVRPDIPRVAETQPGSRWVVAGPPAKAERSLLGSI